MRKSWLLCDLVKSVVLGSLIAASPAQSQGRVDPIGELKKTATFDRAQGVDVGKSSKGKLACFFREESGSFSTDIGMNTDGAFIRVEHGQPLPEPPIPKPPVRIFAGKELTKLVDGDVKSTGEYEPLQIYGGAVDYVPNIDTMYGTGFVIVAKGDAKSFFEIVARARREYIVVQSVSEPKDIDSWPVVDFKASTISALLSCAKKHIH